MKRIESKDDMIKWAKEVNSGISLSRKCDMQDEYAHSNQSDIDKFFVECGQDRRLVLCSVHNTMAFEEVERLLVVLAKHKLNEMIKDEQSELDNRWTDLARAEAIFEESKRPIYKRIEELRKESVYFVERTNHFRMLYQQESTKRVQSADKAKKYDKIKSLLA